MSHWIRTALTGEQVRTQDYGTARPTVRNGGVDERKATCFGRLLCPWNLHWLGIVLRALKLGYSRPRSSLEVLRMHYISEHAWRQRRLATS